MKILIIYKSVHHGNTRRIAEAMAEAVGADLKEPYEVDTDSLGEYDLIGFGSGIYYWKHHMELLHLADSLSATKNKKAFIFSTRGFGSPTLYHQILKKKLLEKGFEVVGEFSCRSQDTAGPLKIVGGINKGRPNQQDIENACGFAEGLRKKIQTPASLSASSTS